MINQTVFIVDDDLAVRKTLSLVVRAHGMVAQDFASAEAFLASCDPQTPGCAIVDLRLPGGMDGFQLLAEMKKRGYVMPAVMLTAYGDIPTAVQATKQGAADFLLKPVRNEDLLRAVHDALSSARAAPPALPDDPPDSAWHECLTKREREIVDLAIAGKSSKEIGRILGISNRTVDVHRAHVLEKTGAKSIFDIARTIWSER